MRTQRIRASVIVACLIRIGNLAARLADLLAELGAPLGDALRGTALASYVLATGSDRYRRVLAPGEIDPVRPLPIGYFSDIFWDVFCLAHSDVR